SGAQGRNLRTSGPAVEYDMLAGEQPGVVQGALVVQLDEETWRATVPLASAVELAPPIVEPEVVELDPLGLTRHNLRFEANFLPDYYLARSVRLQVSQGDEVRLTCNTQLSTSPA